MINTETIKFISLLNELAEKSKNGLYPFSEATSEQKDGLLYDDKTLFNDLYPLITDYLIDSQHHDIISTYTHMYDADNIIIGVKVGDDTKEAYVLVTSRDDADFCVVIHDGRWYQT